MSEDAPFYLHAHEMGLEESMRKFDAGNRGNVVANEAPIEQPPLCHELKGEDEKNLLH